MTVFHYLHLSVFLSFQLFPYFFCSFSSCNVFFFLPFSVLLPCPPFSVSYSVCILPVLCFIFLLLFPALSLCLYFPSFFSCIALFVFYFSLCFRFSHFCTLLCFLFASFYLSLFLLLLSLPASCFVSDFCLGRGFCCPSYK
jgi:hypothetical protein